MKKMLFAALLLAAFAVQPVSGASITSKAIAPVTIREEMAKLETSQRADYAKKVMSMISTMPVPPDSKAATFAQAAITLVASSGTVERPDVVGAIFAGVPLEYINAVSDILAKPFSQKNNKLSDEAYDSVAERIITATEARIKADRADTPIARLTVVTALFVRGSSDPDRTKEACFNALPKDENLRKTVNTWLPAVVAGDFSTIAAVGGVKELVQLEPAAKPDSKDGDSKSEAELRTFHKLSEDQAKPPILERNIYDSLALLSDTVIETDQMFGLRVPVGLTDPRASLVEPGNPGIGMPNLPSVLPPKVDVEDPDPPVPPPPYRGQRTSR